MNNMLPPIFKNWSQFWCNIHYYGVAFSIKVPLYKKTFRTNDFWKLSVTVSVIYWWNKTQDQMGEIALKNLKPSSIKWLLINEFIKSCWFSFLSNFVHSLWIYNGYSIVLCIWLYFPQPYNCQQETEFIYIHIYIHIYVFTFYIYIYIYIYIFICMKLVNKKEN